MLKSCKPAFIAAVGVFLVSSASAEDVRDASKSVVACQSIADPMEKLACFEAAAEAVSQALAEPQAAAPVAEGNSAAATALVEQANQASAEPVAPAPQAQSVASVETPETEERRLLPSWIPSISLNRDSKREARSDTFDIAVTRIQRNNVGRHYFTTADGQVWRQVEVKDVDPPSTLPAPAQLKRGAIGSIRLVFEEHPRDIYKVVRVE